MPPIVQRRFSGPRRAAIVLLALGEEYGRVVWERLDDEEVRTISAVMAHLGVVESDQVENLFVVLRGQDGAGSSRATWKTPVAAVPGCCRKHRVAQIMEEIGSKSIAEHLAEAVAAARVGRRQLHEDGTAADLRTDPRPPLVSAGGEGACPASAPAGRGTPRPHALGRHHRATRDGAESRTRCAWSS